jgi:hypothetical protein
MLVLFLLVQIRTVQMYVANIAAIYLSDRLHTTVKIGSIDIQFFKKVVLEDVYIEDQHHDTLLYSERMKLKFQKIDFKNHILNIDGLEVLNTNYKLIKYKTRILTSSLL